MEQTWASITAAKGIAPFRVKSILCTPESVYVSPACRDPQSSGKWVWSPRTGVVGSCETLSGRWEPDRGLWQEWQVLLTARLLFVPLTNNLSWEFLVCSSAVSVPQWQSQPPPWGPCICWVVLSWSPSSGSRGNICAATGVTSVQQLLLPLPSPPPPRPHEVKTGME